MSDTSKAMDEERVERAVKRARELFAQDAYNCSMAVMSALLEFADCDPLDLLPLAAPFGGGIARAGLTCGALTGAVLALGMTTGPRKYTSRDDRTMAYRLVAPLVEGFRRRMGSALCAEITGVDISTEAGRERFRKLNILEERCVPAVQLAARLGAEIILSG